MEYVKLTKAQIHSMMGRVPAGITETYSAPGPCYALMICSGTLPDPSIFDAIGTNTTADFSSMISQFSNRITTSTGGKTLVTYRYNSTGNGNPTIMGVTGGWSIGAGGVLSTTETPYIAAHDSGTATWFLWVRFYGYQSGYNGYAGTYGAIAGTVSGPSGDGDLRMHDTNIVTGRAYRVGAISVTLPTEYEF